MQSIGGDREEDRPGDGEWERFNRRYLFVGSTDFPLQYRKIKKSTGYTSVAMRTKYSCLEFLRLKRVKRIAREGRMVFSCA
jgi:hypothetical protein